MPDWTEEVRSAIAKLNIGPTREASLVEELSQHLTDRYNELRGNGVEDEQAYRLLKEELSDGRLVAELRPLLSPSPEAPTLGLDTREPLFAGIGKDLRPGSAVAASEPRFCSGGDSLAGAWHRRQYCHFRADRCRSDANTARAFTAATRRHPGDSRWADRKHGCQTKRILLRPLGSVAATAEGLFRDCCLEY